MTITPGVGVTYHGGDTLAQYDRITLWKRDTNEWVGSAVSAGSGGSSGEDPSYNDLVTLAAPTMHWKFDEASGTVAEDATANNRDGTIDGATVNQTPLLEGGKSYSFDGTNDRVYRADEAALRLGSAFTLEAVIYPTAVTAFRTVACKKDAVSTAEAWGFGVNAGAAEFWWTPGGGVYYTLNGGTIAQNTRYLLTVTHDGSNPKLYVNGAQVATLTQNSFPRPAITLPFTVGLSDGGGDAFAGRIDGIALFAGAHAAADIADRFAALDVA